MKYRPDEQNSNDNALITAVTSALRSIQPSYDSAQTWFMTRNHVKSMVSPILPSRKSKYYIPLFGSVFASALAFVMILTSQNSPISSEIATFDANLALKLNEVSTFSVQIDEVIPPQTQEKQVLAKIDAQSRSTSRTQADDAFTASLDVETSLQDLFQ